MRRVGRVDQRLRGDAANVEASSSDPVRLDENRVLAKLARADRGDITAGPAADDEDLAAKLVHLTRLLLLVARRVCGSTFGMDKILSIYGLCCAGHCGM